MHSSKSIVKPKNKTLVLNSLKFYLLFTHLYRGISKKIDLDDKYVNSSSLQPSETSLYKGKVIFTKKPKDEEYDDDVDEMDD